MKHRQINVGRVGPINPDGHAIGLDLGATAVRASILALGTLEGRPSVTVHGMGAMPLPPGAIINGVIREPGVVTGALQRLWDVNDFGCHHVILGFANPQVVVRPLQIPDLSPAQRAKALPFQAREIIALPLNEVILDFTQLGEVNPATKMVDGLLIAAPRAPILIAVDVVERAGLKVARVDLSSFGAMRAIASENLAVEAIIDLGAQLTNIVIHNRGVPQLVRTLARGGQGLTELLADSLHMTFEEAEQAKYKMGLVGQRSSSASALDEGVRPLLAEIRSSINYYRAAHDGASVQRISLTGKAAALPGLAEALASQNGVPANLIDPMQHIRNRWASTAVRTEETDRAASAVSIGLAMGAAA